jgi:hypothetical protein
LLERAIEAETLQGTPQIDIKYQNEEASEAALQKLYNVSAGINIKPQTKPFYEPGKGENPRTDDDTETESNNVQKDYSDYFGDYPSTAELTKEICKGKKKVEHRVRKETVYLSADEDEGATLDDKEYENWREERFKKDREEKERERKRLAEQIKNSEYMLTRKAAREKKMPDKVGLNNSVLGEQSKKPGIAKEESKTKTQGRDSSDDRRKFTYNKARDGAGSRTYNRNNSRDNDDRRRNRNDGSRSGDRQNNRNDRSWDRRDQRNRGWSRSQSRERQERPKKWEYERRDRTRSRGEERQGRSRERGYDRQERQGSRGNDRQDRGRSRERRQNTTSRTYYTSTGRDNSRYSTRSQSNQRESRDRSDSRNRKEYGITRGEFEKYKGLRFSDDYNMKYSMRKCDKCGSWFHHPWQCKKYERYSPTKCTICNKQLHHWETDCMGSFREDDVPYPRGRVFRRQDSRSRTPEANRRQPSKDRRENGNNRGQAIRDNRSSSREKHQRQQREWSDEQYRQQQSK